MSNSAPHHSGIDQIPKFKWIGKYLRSTSAVVEIRYHVSSCPSGPPKRFGSVVGGSSGEDSSGDDPTLAEKIPRAGVDGTIMAVCGENSHVGARYR